MRHAKVPLLCVLGLCLVALIAGCGSTSSGSGSTTTGTFTLGANAAVTVTQGQTSTITVTPTSANSFAGSVQVSVSGLPSGVTVSPATATLTMGSSTTFTLTAAADAALGTTTVKVYGSSGILSTSTPVALTVVATTPISTGDFTLTAAPSTLALTQGTSGQVTLSGTAIDGFSGTIAVAVNGLPTGVTASPTTISVTSNTPVVVTLTAASDAPVAGPVTVNFVGTSGTLSSSTSVALTVVATTPITTADFTLTASPSTLALTQGTNGQVTLSSTAINGFSGTIAVAVNGLPTGVTASPTTISVIPNTPFVVTLTATSNAPVTGPVAVNFVGTSGTLSHTATIQLSVVAPGPDFAMTVTPNTLTLPQGSQSDPLQVGVTATGGFNGTVTFAVSGLPTDVTMIPPSGASLTPGQTEPIVFVATADAPLGTTTVTITGTSGGLTRTTTLKLTVSAPPPPDAITITFLPTSQTVTVGSIAEVSVTATTPPEYTDQITVTPQNLPTGVMVSPVSALVTPGVPQTFVLIAGQNATPATSNVTFLGQVNSVNGSADLSLTVVASPTALLDAPTWHYNTARTGLYSSETSLTPTNVTKTTFGKKATYTTDAAVDAQPLFLSGLTIGAQAHNVLYTATENDTVYAWDADSGSPLWQKSAIGSGETASDNQGCSELPSTVGISSTPVIDRYFGPDGVIYFVAKTKDGSGNYHQRLHALDLTTGAELSGSPVEIAATYPATSGTDTFDPSIMVERAALLLSNGTVYISWAAPCHQTSFDYQSWVMAYSEATLAQQSVLNLTPNGNGGGIWMSGAGPAADADGNVFLITSEGTFDTTLVAGSNSNLYPANGDYGNGYVKIQPTNGVMSLFDYFEPLNGVQASATNYQDQGSGGVLLVPDISIGGGNFLSLAVGAGKDGNIYEMGRTGSFLGEYDGQNDNNINTMSNALANGASSSPAYFNQILFYGGIGDSVKAINVLSQGAAISQSANTLGTAGATPVVSANGTSTPVVWALDTTASGGPVLYAYDATDLTTELYDSTMQASRDAVDATSKYSVPVVANGHVYIGTQTGVNVFGLLP
jgi:hypothetical protein